MSTALAVPSDTIPPVRAIATASSPDDEHLLNRDDAARFLGVASATLATWAARGTHNLPLVKIGRLVRYRLGDLRRFVAERSNG